LGKAAAEPYIANVNHRRLRPALRLASLAAFALALASPVAAKELATGTGAFIDMPSGFSPGEGDGESRFSYFDPEEAVELDILIFEPGRYRSSDVMAADLLAQMGSAGDHSGFTCQGRSAVLAELGFALDGAPRRGYALFICGANGSENSYALVASADTARFPSYSELIISCLDAFSIDAAARRFPGPVSQFLFHWPAARTQRRTVTLPGNSVSLPWSPDEAQQELSVAEREYRVLSMYVGSEALWPDAWARYYRMVYRESAARLDNLTQAFSGTLPASDPTECARRALAWVQGFSYERGFAGIDFVPPLTAAFEQRGDCDSRAMVMAIILERMGIDCVLMVSRAYSHAMLAVDVPGGGQRFTFNGRAYLVAETTAKVGFGMIDSSQTDASLWLGVDLGD
jgi:hypothetical protein